MPFGANAQRDSVAAAPQKIRGVQYSPDNVASAQQKELPFLPVSLFRETLPGLFCLWSHLTANTKVLSGLI